MLTKNIRILITFAVLAGLVFSTSVALANFSNGPENPGPIVMRGEAGLAIWYPDYKAGLSVVHGKSAGPAQFFRPLQVGNVAEKYIENAMMFAHD